MEIENSQMEEETYALNNQKQIMGLRTKQNVVF